LVSPLLRSKIRSKIWLEVSPAFYHSHRASNGPMGFAIKPLRALCGA
jgi:hypothetical protein